MNQIPKDKSPTDTGLVYKRFPKLFKIKEKITNEASFNKIKFFGFTLFIFYSYIFKNRISINGLEAELSSQTISQPQIQSSFQRINNYCVSYSKSISKLKCLGNRIPDDNEKNVMKRKMLCEVKCCQERNQR